MAHKAQKEYVETVKERLGDKFKGKVLDVGSLDVNGTFKDFFKGCDYTGVDIVAGKNVDVVSKGHEYKSKTKFDVVCSGECFEHDEYWTKTVNNMYKLLKKGGLFFFTCASTGRKEHGTTRSEGGLWGTSNDYYKNLTTQDFLDVWDVDKMFITHEFKYNEKDKDLYFFGVKK